MLADLSAVSIEDNFTIWILCEINKQNNRVRVVFSFTYNWDLSVIIFIVIFRWKWTSASEELLLLLFFKRVFSQIIGGIIEKKFDRMSDYLLDFLFNHFLFLLFSLFSTGFLQSLTREIDLYSHCSIKENAQWNRSEK